MHTSFSSQEAGQQLDVSPDGSGGVNRSRDAFGWLRSLLGRRRPDSQVLPKGHVIRLRRQHAQALRAVIGAMGENPPQASEPGQRPWLQKVGLVTVDGDDETRWRRHRRFSDDTRVDVWQNMPSAYRRKDPESEGLVRDAKDTGIEISRPGMRCVIDAVGGMAVYTAHETGQDGENEAAHDRLGAAAVYGLVRDAFADYLNVELPSK